MTTISLGSTKENEDVNMVGFEPYANQRLLPPTFPRYTEIKARKDAYTYLTNLTDRLLMATLVVNHSQSFHSALVSNFL